MTKSKLLLGALALAAAGTVVGLLYNTREGSKIRRKVQRKSNRYAEDLKDKFSDLLDSVSDRYEDYKDDATKRSKELQGR